MIKQIEWPEHGFDTAILDDKLYELISASNDQEERIKEIEDFLVIKSKVQ